ncbi:putative F-box associated interaction domain-containing protein [Medicago truncatula]|uniref:Putative F-box associated interaction domain-containing protein n=1 Tax=Medicago truncatula TaxID=3880 RepID=A0A396HL42_MEDTR|nr:F-box/kelch-repeat protein At3g23880-like [Medicago truncatula]RHN54039.1 putative F-box associated interaction domain-containing protein [Medicago truncatula]
MALAMIISLITTKLLPFFYITIDLMIVVVVAVRKTQVMVHTLGTDSWRLIQDFPSLITGTTYLKSGKFVSGTINWLVCRGDWSIVSLDLRTVSYQQILPPDYGEEKFTFKLGVSRDCLCILGDHVSQRVSDVWLMKEFENRESWTKLVSFHSDHYYSINKVLYIFVDDQLLLEVMKLGLVVYDPINNTLKIQDL